MPDTDVDAAPIVPLATATGFLVALTEGTAADPQRIPVAGLADAVAKASSAVQPDDIGEAAALTVAEIRGIVAEELGDVEAALEAILGPQ